MEQFTIPLASFDVALLPEGARDVTSTEFRAAVDEFFRRQFQELEVNGVVSVTPEQISVGWVAPGFNPVDAALAKLRRGQLRDGVQLLELVRARQPDSPDVLFNLGVALSEMGEFHRAIAILSHLTDIAPDHVHGHVALGVALGRSGNNTAAAEEMSLAVELDPADVWAQKNLGGTLFRQGRGTEARGHLEVAVHLAPNDAQAWLLLGDICRSLGDTTASRQALQRARALDPHGPIRDQSEALLNRMAESELARDSDGINPKVLEAMIGAVKRLRSMPPESAKRLTLQAALLGQNGLRLFDSTQTHRLEGIAEPLTSLEVACLIHAGVQMVSPGAETGFPFDREFTAAQEGNDFHR